MQMSHRDAIRAKFGLIGGSPCDWDIILTQGRNPAVCATCCEPVTAKSARCRPRGRAHARVHHPQCLFEELPDLALVPGFDKLPLDIRTRLLAAQPPPAPPLATLR